MEELKEFWSRREKMNLTIVLFNIGIFIVMEIGGYTEDGGYMLSHGASYAPFILENGEYYRLLTSMFLHFGIEHLFSNMLVLVFLGDILEKHVGKIKYLLIYILGGFGGNLLSLYQDVSTGEYGISAGASGAIFAVIGALIYIVIRNKGRLEDLSGKRLLLMAALTLFQGFTSFGVDNFAHVGGLLTGAVVCILLYRRKGQLTQSGEGGW